MTRVQHCWIDSAAPAADILRGLSEVLSTPAPVLAPRWRRTIVLLLLALEALLVVGVARRTGCTIDEPQYVNGAHIILRHGWAHERTVLQGPLALYANQDRKSTRLNSSHT